MERLNRRISPSLARCWFSYYNAPADTVERHCRLLPLLDDHGSITMTLGVLRLQPGRYALDVAARSGDNVSLDYLPACVWIDVLPGPTTPAVIIRETGGVREPQTGTGKPVRQQRVQQDE